jgi:DNA-binding Lrp family transcriptional regulator
MTLQAYVLVQAEPRLAGRVASAIRDLQQVFSCEVLAGPYDAIAVVEGPDLDALGTTVVSRIQLIDGVTRTLTCPIVQLERS